MQNPNVTSNITDLLVEKIEEFSGRDISEAVRQQAKFCLADYFACAAMGRFSLGGQAEKLCDAFGATGGGAVLVSGSDTTPQNAAFVNGVFAHEIELDDGHRFAMMHPGAVVISALLAMASREQISSEDLIRGIVAGYEFAVRIAASAQPGQKLKGFHATGTCGTIGAAIAVGVMLRYDAAQMKGTISAAATDAAGLLEMIDDGSELKPYNIGRAASAAVNAALIGRLYFKGPDDALGGKRGFFATHADNVNREYLLNGLGERPAIELIYRKPYAACRHCHAPIEAALQLRRDSGIRLEDIQEIAIETYDLAVKGHEHTQIRGVSSAKMSIPYSVASAMALGTGGFECFTEERVRDRDILELTRKVRVSEDEELSALVPEKRAAVVTVRTGEAEYSQRVDYPKGEPENPITPEELREKYGSLMKSAGCAESDAEQLYGCIMGLENRFDDFLKWI